jgi:hypothetical protein
MNANILKECERVYKNNGQHAEYRFAYTLTGEHRKADNHKGGADVGIYQVKSFRATVCHGESLENIFKEYEDAEKFAFVDDEENVWYELTKEEFVEFAKTFAVLTRDSAKNGGKAKYQLNRQYRQQREWFRQ